MMEKRGWAEGRDVLKVPPGRVTVHFRPLFHHYWIALPFILLYFSSDIIFCLLVYPTIEQIDNILPASGVPITTK